MTPEASQDDDDDYVTHGKSVARYVVSGKDVIAFTAHGDTDDPYVIHGKNLIAEVSAAAHSDLVSFFTHEGLSVSSERIEHTDTIRVQISGRAEAVDDSVGKFVEQNPQVPLHIVGTAGGEEASGGHSSG